MLETEKWQASKKRLYQHWDWRKERSHFASRYPKRFEVALWQSNKLIGVSLGRPTCNATGLRLDIIEGSPSDLGDRPPVTIEVLLAYEVYAKMIGASHIRIMKPVNEDVKNYYCQLGYTYVSDGKYSNEQERTSEQYQ